MRSVGPRAEGYTDDMIYLLAWTLPTQAATLTVGSDLSYSTISEAIEASEDGDVISVEPGIYAEGISLSGKAISVVAAGSPAETFITGNGSFTVLIEGGEGPETEISGFTISGTDHTCINIENSSPTLSSLIIEMCGGELTARGGGAALINASPTFTDVVFRDNEAINGGGMALGEESTATLNDCAFENNTATHGGAIRADTSGLVLSETSLSDNTAAFGNGGAIWASESTISMTECEANNNSAALDGGGIFALSTDLDIDTTAFSENIALYGDGGAVVMHGTETANILGVTFIENQAWSMGGAISAHDVAALNVEASALEDNIANDEMGGGGAIGVQGSELTLSTVEIEGNLSVGAGGGLYALSSNVLGVDLEVDNNIAYGEGGGWYQSEGTAELQDSTFKRNDGSSGGGGLSSDADHVSITDCLFEWNESTGGDGGAIKLSGATADLHGTWLMRNSAQQGGGLHSVLSGALYVTTTVLQENMSMFTAGGAFITGPGSALAQIHSNDFIGNESLTSGSTAQLALGSINIDIRNNIIAYGRNGYGLSIMPTTDTAPQVMFNDFWENEGGNVSGITDPTGTDGNISEDPGFVEISIDRDFDNDNLDLALDSPCIGAGDPLLSDDDDEPSDIGAFGVTDIPDIDNDGDGFPPDAGGDCDDDDPSVNPDADEICDDEIDNNCNGEIDEDCSDDTGSPDTGLDDTGSTDTGGIDDTGSPADPDDEDRPGDDTGVTLSETEKLYEIGGEGCSCAATSSGHRVFWLSLLPLILLRRRQT